MSKYFYISILFCLQTQNSSSLHLQIVRSSNNVSKSAGLPAPWKQQDIGAVTIRGDAKFNGRQFQLESAGTYTDSLADKCHYTYFEADAESELTVRLVPQPSSPLSRIGLMMRESLAPGSPQVSLVLNPGKREQVTEPEWHALQLARNFNGKPLVIKNKSEPLAEPVVTYGRLTGYYWLRLQRKFNSFYAFTSADGKSWTSLGNTFVEMNKKFYAGITISSGLKGATARVTFDHVSLPGWSSDE